METQAPNNKMNNQKKADARKSYEKLCENFCETCHEWYPQSDDELNMATQNILNWIDQVNKFSNSTDAIDSLKELYRTITGYTILTVGEIKGRRMECSKPQIGNIKIENGFQAGMTPEILEKGRAILKKMKLEKHELLPLSEILNPHIVVRTEKNKNEMLVTFIDGTKIIVPLDVYQGALCKHSNDSTMELEKKIQYFKSSLGKLSDHNNLGTILKRSIELKQNVEDIVEIIGDRLEIINTLIALIEIYNEFIERNKVIIKPFENDYDNLVALYEFSSKTPIKFDCVIDDHEKSIESDPDNMDCDKDPENDASQV